MSKILIFPKKYINLVPGFLYYSKSDYYFYQIQQNNSWLSCVIQSPPPTEPVQIAIFISFSFYRTNLSLIQILPNRNYKITLCWRGISYLKIIQTSKLDILIFQLKMVFPCVYTKYNARQKVNLNHINVPTNADLFQKLSSLVWGLV